MPHAERSPLAAPVHDAVDVTAPQALEDAPPIPPRALPAPVVATELPLQAATDEPLATATATADDIIRAIEAALENAQTSQRKGAEAALVELGQPATPAPSWITSLVASMAELVVALPLGLLAGAITQALLGAGDATKGIVSQLARIASGVGKSARDDVTSYLAADDDSTADIDLLVKYRHYVDLEIGRTQTRARMNFELDRSRLAALPPAVLGAMAQRLDPTRELVVRLFEEQRKSVLLGWMRLCAELSLGTEEVKRSGSAGFADVYVSCPDRVEGGHGCAVERVDVHSHPSVAALVKGSTRTILAAPIHRRVFLSTRGTDAGLGWSEPAYELDPDHHITVLPNAHLLAALGSGGVAAAGAIKDVIEHHQALAGATIINDLLSNTPLRSTR